MTTAPSRRQFLSGVGVIAVGFALGATAPPAAGASPRGAVRVSDTPATTASWLVLDGDAITVYSGKVELGTGVRTSLAQVVAEELRLTVADVRWVQGDTRLGAEQAGTFGSKTLQNGGPELRRAAATAFAELRRRAAVHFHVGIDAVEARDGRFFRRSRPQQSITYGKLAGMEQSVLANDVAAPLVPPEQYRVVGTSVPRVDLPGKLDATFEYVGDVRLKGMQHGRVVRPPGRNAHLAADAVITGVPSGARLVRKGDFVGVVAGSEWAAARAATALTVPWTPGPALWPPETLPQTLRDPANSYAQSLERNEVTDLTVFDGGYRQQYYTPFYLHGPMGAACAVADVRAAPDRATGIQATIWCSSQNVFELRRVLAALLGLAEAVVQVLYVEASGCYGHDGSDDVAADAALLSQATVKPVKVQWTRQDDFGWEPAAPAQAHDLCGVVADGKITAWQHQLYTPSANSRPVRTAAGSVLAGKLTGSAPDLLPPSTQVNQATRNYPVNYRFPQHTPAKLVRSFVTTAADPRTPQLPVVYTLPRSSALRSLGGFSNSFANESFFDELAERAGRDPLDLRIEALAAKPGDTDAVASDAARAQAVCQALRGDWKTWHDRHRNPPAERVGAGVAFQRYETTGAFVATMVEVQVDAAGTVKVDRVVVAHDCGLIVNPDGLRNQIQGNVIQGVSRTLYEEATYAGDRMTSTVWQENSTRPDKAYRVIRFTEIPREIKIILIGHPDKPAFGAGEPTLGTMPGAIANAVRAATGTRVRTLPLRLPAANG
jgi:CO/xanthine dehydrogenase Mo-binding subunit